MKNKLPKKISIGDKYRPAMEITSQEEADAYFETLVEHSMTHFEKTREDAETSERTNLGYFAGYYDSRTRERVENLFKCEHPYFGSVAKNGIPTAEEAFKMGFEMGKNNEKQN